jgi:hypothetical protein
MLRSARLATPCTAVEVSRKPLRTSGQRQPQAHLDDVQKFVRTHVVRHFVMCLARSWPLAVLQSSRVTFVIVRARGRTFTPGSPVPVADAGYV